MDKTRFLQAGAAAEEKSLEYGQTTALEALVEQAAEAVNKHLMKILFDKYKFFEHCLAIKRYLLLGQGDFIQALMDAVG
jgi:gamma-tubulin complex component 3